MKTHARLLLSAAVALLTVASVSAQTVQYIIVSKEQYATQLTNSSVGAAYNFRFEASVEGSGLSGITAPTLNSIAGGFGTTGALTKEDPLDGNRWIYQQNFATGALLESAYASNTTPYNMTVQGVSVDIALLNETPRFTPFPIATVSGGTISGGVLVWDVSQSLTISLADPLNGSLAGIDHTSLSIWGTGIDRGTDAFGSGPLSITIGGSGVNNTFIAGQTYTVEMDFINIIGGTLPTTISGGALDGAAYAGVYGRTVSFQIQAVPEPSTYAALAGAAALGLAFWHRRRKAQVAA